MVGETLNSVDEIIGTAQTIRERGVATVLSSMGSRGMIRITEGDVFHATPLEVDIVNTIGAGDSSVAGYVYGLVNGFEPQKALACAVAARAATVIRAGTALCTKEDFGELLQRTTFKRIAGN